MKTSLNEKDNQLLLCELIAGSTSARANLIEGNIPLVYWVVNKFAKSSTKRRLLYNDLVGVGNLALVKGVDDLAEHYRPEGSIATYLRRTIEHAIVHFLDRENTISVPDRTQRLQRQSELAVAEWLPQIRKRHALGESHQSIANWLNKTKCASANGQQFTAAMIRRLIEPPKPPKRVSAKALSSIAAPDEIAAFDMYDLIMSCAENSLQREMLILLANGYTDRRINRAISIPMGTISIWREEIYARVREKAGLKEHTNEN